MLIAEVAREARVSISSVRHWLHVGKLPFVRPGRRVMVRRENFERFIDRGGSCPNRDVQTEPTRTTLVNCVGAPTDKGNRI